LELLSQEKARVESELQAAKALESLPKADEEQDELNALEE